jgi:hypothetical protein
MFLVVPLTVDYLLNFRASIIAGSSITIVSVWTTIEEVVIIAAPKFVFTIVEGTITKDVVGACAAI